MDKMQISVLNVQRSLCILFHAGEADKLNRLNGSRELLRVPAGTHQPGKQQSNKNRHASEYHVYLLDHEVQSVSTKVRQHERTSSVGGPSRQAATPSRIPCFICLAARDDVCLTFSWMPAIPSISPRLSNTSVIPS